MTPASVSLFISVEDSVIASIARSIVLVASTAMLLNFSYFSTRMVNCSLAFPLLCFSYALLKCSFNSGFTSFAPFAAASTSSRRDACSHPEGRYPVARSEQRPGESTQAGVNSREQRWGGTTNSPGRESPGMRASPGCGPSCCTGCQRRRPAAFDREETLFTPDFIVQSL